MLVGFTSLHVAKELSAPADKGINLKRQEEIKHKINDFEDRWGKIEAQNATWWQETSDNLKKEFRPDVLEKLKDLPLFSSNLPPLDTKFDLNNIDTRGIVLTEKEKEAVEDKIKRFDRAVGQSNKWWGEIQNDIRDMKLSPQETDELKKTEASLLFTDRLPPSRHVAKQNYKNEQERKKAEEERTRKEQEKKDFSLKINEALGTNTPQAMSLKTSSPQIDYGKTPNDINLKTDRPSVEGVRIDDGLALSSPAPHSRLNSLTPPPNLATDSFNKHLTPHTATVPQTSSEHFANIPGGVAKYTIPQETASASSTSPPPLSNPPTGNSYLSQTPPIKAY